MLLQNYLLSSYYAKIPEVPSICLKLPYLILPHLPRHIPCLLNLLQDIPKDLKLPGLIIRYLTLLHLPQLIPKHLLFKIPYGGAMHAITSSYLKLFQINSTYIKLPYITTSYTKLAPLQAPPPRLADYFDLLQVTPSYLKIPRLTSRYIRYMNAA
jgi:hypothetical protein